MSSFPILAWIVTDLLAILLFPLPNLKLFKQPSSTTFSESFSVRVFRESYCIYNHLLDTDLCYFYSCPSNLGNNSLVLFVWKLVNPFVPNAPFPYPLKNSEIHKQLELLNMNFISFFILLYELQLLLSIVASHWIFSIFKNFIYQYNCRQFHLKIFKLIIYLFKLVNIMGNVQFVNFYVFSLVKINILQVLVFLFKFSHTLLFLALVAIPQSLRFGPVCWWAVDVFLSHSKYQSLCYPLLPILIFKKSNVLTMEWFHNNLVEVINGKNDVPDQNTIKYTGSSALRYVERVELIKVYGKARAHVHIFSWSCFLFIYIKSLYYE